MNSTVLDKAKIFNCVHSGSRPIEISASLKSYADTLLFYFLGVHCAHSNILEIGLGGSSYLLRDIAAQCQKQLWLVDNELEAIENYGSKSDLFTNELLKTIYQDSQDFARELASDQKFSYIHLDGGKEFYQVHNDLELAINHLDNYGIICQDDFGNNKWPTVTNCVYQLMQEHELEFLIIGDSSCWLVKKADKPLWIQYLSQLEEFNLLQELLSIASSKILQDNANYFFLSTNCFRLGTLHYQGDQSSRLAYFSKLLKNNDRKYLKMPYENQSQIGINIITQEPYYKLKDIWEQISDSSWGPAPQSQCDINNLPDRVIEEIRTVHMIDPYEIVLAKSYN